MPKRGSAVHVSTHRRQYVGKDGVERDYETHLLRRSYREDGKVKNETVANLSHLPADLIEMIRASLAGEAFVPAAAVATVARTRPRPTTCAWPTRPPTRCTRRWTGSPDNRKLLRPSWSGLT